MAVGDGIDFAQLQRMGTSVLRAGNDVVSSAVGMGGELLQANQKLSDYSNALSANTRVFGALKNVVNGLVQFAEQSLEEYQTLTGIGATFGKEMVNIKRTAAELGMTVKDMTEFLQQNTDSLRAFGGTTDQAISRFRAFSKEMLDSPAGTELRRLGFTAKDINQTLMTYNELAQQDGLNNRRSAAEQIASAREYALELDGLSKLTGKQRKDIEDEMKKRRREGDVQAFLMGQSAETQENFMLATQKISDTMGPQFAELFKDLMIRGAPITEETRNAFIALGGSADEFEATVASFRQGMQTDNFDAFNNSLTQAQGAFAGYLKTEEARNVAMLGGLSNISGAMGQAYESSYDFANALDAAAEVEGEDPAQTLQNIQTSIAEQQQQQMTDQGRLIDQTITLQEDLRQLTVAATSQVLPRLEEAAIRAINMMREALPTADQMARELGDGIGRMFDAAERSIYPEGMMGQLGALGDDVAQGDDIAEAAATITGAEEAAAAEIDESLTETETRLHEDVVGAREALEAAQAESDAARSAAEAELAAAQADLSSEVPEIAAQARQRVEQAEATLNAAIDEGNARVLSAMNSLNRAQAVQRLGGAPTNAQGQTDWRYAPRRAKGGRIGMNEVALVGESGAEFIAGPGEVMGAKDSMGVLKNLMKGIRVMESSFQEQSKQTQNQISNLDNGSFGGSDLAGRLDNMISVMERLVNIEYEAAGTAKRTFRATRGLQGNMLKGLGA